MGRTRLGKIVHPNSQRVFFVTTILICVIWGVTLLKDTWEKLTQPEEQNNETTTKTIQTTQTTHTNSTPQKVTAKTQNPDPEQIIKSTAAAVTKDPFFIIRVGGKK